MLCILLFPIKNQLEIWDIYFSLTNFCINKNCIRNMQLLPVQQNSGICFGVLITVNKKHNTTLNQIIF